MKVFEVLLLLLVIELCHLQNLLEFVICHLQHLVVISILDEVDYQWVISHPRLLVFIPIPILIEL